MTAIVVALGLLACGYLAAAAGVWLFQGRLVFHPAPAPLDRTPADAGLDYEAISPTTADGVELSGWHVAGPSPEAPAVLFLHGNAGNIAGRIETLRMLYDAGAATLIIDYRGYGASEGRPSEQGLYRDAEAAWDWLVTEGGYSGDRIVVFGRSLGGAVAAHLASRRPAAGLILESSFTSLPAVAVDLYPWLPARALARYRFDTAASLARTRCPVLVAHARDDRLIPLRHGQRLARVRAEATEWLELAGSHNDAFFVSGGRYRRAFAGFIARVTAAPPG